jgi:glycosyltransferase involved in cell wall biosynthesis
MKHTFAVPAYGDSPYLEACLKSLKKQTVPSDIILCTSTPSPFLKEISDRYGVPLYIREGEKGIGRDWNFAFDRAETDLVTIAHQDDLYEHDYTKTLFEAKEKYPDMSLFTTASVTLKKKKLTEWGIEETVKKLLRMPLRCPGLCGLGAVKKSVFLLGNPVICPSCTYDRTFLNGMHFSETYQFILDWDFLYRLAGMPGRFVCSEKPLIIYRIHEGAATFSCIEGNIREREEAEMFGRLWPKPAAESIRRLYRRSYEAYRE